MLKVRHKWIFVLKKICDILCILCKNKDWKQIFPQWPQCKYGARERESNTQMQSLGVPLKRPNLGYQPVNTSFSGESTVLIIHEYLGKSNLI